MIYLKIDILFIINLRGRICMLESIGANFIYDNFVKQKDTIENTVIDEAILFLLYLHYENILSTKHVEYIICSKIEGIY